MVQRLVDLLVHVLVYLILNLHSKVLRSSEVLRNRLVYEHALVV